MSHLMNNYGRLPVSFDHGPFFPPFEILIKSWECWVHLV